MSIVPGVMHCAKCGFQLIRVSLNVASDTVTAGNNKTEPCPNRCGPLWPMTWEQRALYLEEVSTGYIEQIAALRAQLEERDARIFAAERERDEAKARHSDGVEDVRQHFERKLAASEARVVEVDSAAKECAHLLLAYANGEPGSKNLTYAIKLAHHIIRGTADVETLVAEYLGDDAALSQSNGGEAGGMSLRPIDDEEEVLRGEWALGDYDNGEDGCPNCGRSRLCLCANGKHRCEKCNWSPELNDYAPVDA